MCNSLLAFFNTYLLKSSSLNNINIFIFSSHDLSSQSKGIVKVTNPLSLILLDRRRCHTRPSAAKCAACPSNSLVEANGGQSKEATDGVAFVLLEMLSITGNDVTEVGPDSEEVAPEIESIEETIDIRSVWPLGSHHHSKQTEDLDHLSQHRKLGGTNDGRGDFPIRVGCVFQVGADSSDDQEPSNGNEESGDCTGVHSRVEQTSNRSRQDAIDQPARHGKTNDADHPAKNLERSRGAFAHFLCPIDEINPGTSDFGIAGNEAHVHAVNKDIPSPVVVVFWFEIPRIDPVNDPNKSVGQCTKETKEQGVRCGVHLQGLVPKEFSRNKDVGVKTSKSPNNAVQVESTKHELDKRPRCTVRRIESIVPFRIIKWQLVRSVNEERIAIAVSSILEALVGVAVHFQRTPEGGTRTGLASILWSPGETGITCACDHEIFRGLCISRAEKSDQQSR